MHLFGLGMFCYNLFPRSGQDENRVADGCVSIWMDVSTCCASNGGEGVA